MQNRPTGRKTNVTGQAKQATTHGQAAGQAPVGNQGGYQGRPSNGPSGPSGGNRPTNSGNRPSGNRDSGSSGGGGKLGLIGILLVLLLGGGGLSGMFGGGGDGGQTQTVLPEATAYTYVTETPRRTATPTPRRTQAPTAVPATEEPAAEDSWMSLLNGFLGYGSGSGLSGSGSYAQPSSSSSQGSYTDLSSLAALLGGQEYAATVVPEPTATPKPRRTATPRRTARKTATPKKTAAPAVNSQRAPYTSIVGNGQDTVTIMVYMCGADLESRSGMATRDLQEMLAADIGEKVNLIILTGGSTSWRNNLVSSKVHQLWQVKGGKLKCLSQDEGTASMTSPSTLSSFIRKTAQNFPADRYFLILWDHGSGTVSGYGYDEQNTRSGSMSLAGIDQALSGAGVKFDFVGFDACLMATVETGLMLDRHADYMIASEETEPGYGWYYTDWLTMLNRNTSVDTVTLGTKIADDFVQTSARQAAGQSTTLSVTDLARLSAAVPDKLSAFAQSISGMMTEKQYTTVSGARSGVREFAQSSKLDQVDLTDLANRMGTQEGRELAAAVAQAVRYNRTNMKNAYGLSIYFPFRKLGNVDKAVSAYQQIGMDEDYTRCIRQFASMQTSGQAVTGGSSHSPYGSLTGQSGYSDTSYGSGDLLSGLLGSLLGGDYSAFSGLDRSNTAFMEEQVLTADELNDFLSENLLDTNALVFTDTEEGKKLILPADQWALVQDVQLNMFVDIDGAYVDLGMDALFDFDEEGNLIANEQGTWLAINGTPAPYYLLSNDGITTTGYIPALLSGDRVQLLVTIENESGQAYLVGARADYPGGETETVAKSLAGLPLGAEIQLLCDRYLYDGTYEAVYYWGDPIVVTEDLTISDVVLTGYNVRRCYKLIDLYDQGYWTESY